MLFECVVRSKIRGQIPIVPSVIAAEGDFIAARVRSRNAHRYRHGLASRTGVPHHFGPRMDLAEKIGKLHLLRTVQGRHGAGLDRRVHRSHRHRDRHTPARTIRFRCTTCPRNFSHPDPRCASLMPANSSWAIAPEAASPGVWIAVACLPESFVAPGDRVPGLCWKFSSCESVGLVAVNDFQASTDSLIRSTIRQ